MRPPANSNAAAEAVRKDCPMLYPNGRPSWDCGTGWNDAITRLSYKLEGFNMLFRKSFRAHIEAEQIKEKYGELRFYFSVRRSIPPAPEFVSRTLDRAAQAIRNNVNFNMKAKTVQEYKRTVRFSEIGDDAEDGTPPAPPPPVCGAVLVSPTGKTKFEYSVVNSYGIYKQVPTRRLLTWKFAKLCEWCSAQISSLYSVPTRRQTVVAEMLDQLAEDAVRRAEEECYCACEECGREIGTRYSPRCETKGWIRYLCEPCAKKNGKYTVHGAEKAGKEPTP